MKINIFNEDCEEVLKKLPDNSIDMSIQSPPYDNLRKYQGASDGFTFDKFKAIVDQLYRVMKEGSVTVWIVGDATINGNKTLTSFRQALYFQEAGFLVHDVMIWQKPNSAHPAPRNGKRYSNIWESMFVFVKGKKIRQDITLIADKKNKYFNRGGSWGKLTDRKNGEDDLIDLGKGKLREVPEFSLRNNIWEYNMANVDGDKEFRHPAAYPVQLIKDHILSWSVPGDTILDVFGGGGTTGVAAIELGDRNVVMCEIVKKYYDEMMKPRLVKHMKDGDELIENNYNSFTNNG